VIDLGRDGLAVIAAASTVNLALRTDAEQQSLIGCFARLLHAVSGPVQILIRAQHLDLGPALAELGAATTRLPHPALRAAAADHYRYLAELAARGDLLARQVLIVLREPAGAGPGRASTTAAANRLTQRLTEVHRCLAPAEITVTPLSGATIWVGRPVFGSGLRPPLEATGRVIPTCATAKASGGPAQGRVLRH